MKKIFLILLTLAVINNAYAMFTYDADDEVLYFPSESTPPPVFNDGDAMGVLGLTYTN